MVSNICSSGKNQSPITLQTDRSSICRSKCSLVFYYRGSRLNIIRNDRNLVLNYDTGSYVTYNGNIYELERISFTSPASHIIDNKKAQLECHLYHKSPDTGRMLVLAILLEINEAMTPSKAFFDSWTHNIPTTENDEILLSMDSEWNVFNTLPNTKSFFAYDGSLLTNPCTEGIQWIVMSRFTNIGDASYKKIVSVIGDNARKTQSRGNRRILFNPNSNSKNAVNQSSEIFCITEKQLEEKCDKMNRNRCSNSQNRSTLIYSLVVIIGFLLVLLGIALYKMGYFTKMSNSLKGSIPTKGIGKN